MRITLIGGPTALLEIDGLRLLTDPTFDPAGSEYPSGPVTLCKIAGPACGPDDLEPIDAVLLSHDQHPDNLDNSGKAFLANAQKVFTMRARAERLGGNAVGLAPWQTSDFAAKDGHGAIQITATPARHGPPGIEPVSGEVTGFVLSPVNRPEDSIYVTGDTVWYEGVAEVARRFAVRSIVLFAGAAAIKDILPAHLTMNTEDAIATAQAFPKASIFPVHHQGWKHFTESLQDLTAAFARAGLSDRLHPLKLGVPEELD